MGNSTVFDVAKYILHQIGELTTMKLQKLVYYCQAWSLVWDDGEPLFSDRIEAWANGPVIPTLYNVHKGRYCVNEHFFHQGNIDNLSSEQKETIEKVVDFYGKRSPQWLSDLTHNEEPWRIARKGIPEGERGSSEITLESMAEYYERL